MIVGRIAESFGSAGRAPRDETAPEPVPEVATNRALIPLQPVADSQTPMGARPQARFLAQLIATKQQLPQTRERRRAEPEDAVAVYAAANAAPTVPAGRRITRSM